MLLARIVIVGLLLSAGFSAQARRGLNDSGACVESCSLGAGEPCPPCPPRAVNGLVSDGVLQQYKREVAVYDNELEDYAARNPKFRHSERYEAAKTRRLNAESVTSALV